MDTPNIDVDVLVAIERAAEIGMLAGADTQAALQLVDAEC